MAPRLLLCARISSGSRAVATGARWLGRHPRLGARAGPRRQDLQETVRRLVRVGREVEGPAVSVGTAPQEGSGRLVEGLGDLLPDLRLWGRILRKRPSG